MQTVDEIVEGIKSGNISCEDLVWKIYKRIERSKLNCFITLNKENSLSKAREIDRHREDERYKKKKLLGVPIAIKDSISTKGIQTTCASEILCGYIPPYDATVVKELKKEGAIIIGKTNMDEFCMGSSTETSFFGPVKNPYDLSRVAGGSSGGSAAAIAANESILAIGSDTGGSIRCPASFCGIVGLKPTYGFVSRYGLIAYANSLEQIGPMASNVEDVAKLLEVISISDEMDSTVVKDKNKKIEKNYFSSLKSSSVNVNIKGWRIGVPKEFITGASSEVERAVWDAIHKIEDLGATYEEISMPNMKYALASYYIIAMSEASSNLARFDGLRYGLKMDSEGDWHAFFSKIRREGFGEEVKRRIILGTYALSAGYYSKYYLKALKIRTLIKRDFENAFRKYDVLAMPTMPFVAFKLGEKIEDPLSLYLVDVNTVPINLAGVPSISIPCGISNGLPIGLQLVGGHFEEKKIIEAAFSFEQILKIF